MSKEFPSLRARQLVRVLEKAGFVRWRQKGSHLTMDRASDHRALTVPSISARPSPKDLGLVEFPGGGNYRIP
jgi:predicted RNA binding protein YcfA (HicA-like mRNA interferase family)